MRRRRRRVGGIVLHRCPVHPLHRETYLLRFLSDVPRFLPIPPTLFFKTEFLPLYHPNPKSNKKVEREINEQTITSVLYHGGWDLGVLKRPLKTRARTGNCTGLDLKQARCRAGSHGSDGKSNGRSLNSKEKEKQQDRTGGRSSRAEPSRLC